MHVDDGLPLGGETGEDAPPEEVEERLDAAERLGPQADLRRARQGNARFFEQQVKRSMCPDGPKDGSVSLSPRGDWRMPSDVGPAAWLAELENVPKG